MPAIGNGIGVPFLKGGQGGAPAPNPDFISVWDTTKAGSASDTVVLPLLSGGTYNGTIDWGDGNSDSLSYANRQHTYASGGVYTITISGQIEGWQFNFFAIDERKIIEVVNWGNLTLTRDSAFFGCVNLVITATDAPTIATSTMDRFFRDCDSLVSPDLSQWDVSGVTDMGATFFNSPNFNADVSDWDVSGVVSFSDGTIGMFNNTDFNQDISNWDVSSAENMLRMFDGSPFNQDIGGWNVGNVTSMFEMFGDTPFNQDIGGWNVGNVRSMGSMFNGASSFNQDIGGWNVASVTNMGRMFHAASSFDQDIGGWNVASVTNMERMFDAAFSFDQDISSWNIVNVANFTNFMRYAGLSTVNYDALLVSWESTLQAAYPSGVGYPHTINIHFGGSQYTAGGAADAARASLISIFGWTITDGGSV